MGSLRPCSAFPYLRPRACRRRARGRAGGSAAASRRHVSRSIDDQKFELKRRGYAAALSDPKVLQAIAAGPHGSIAVAFVEWAGADSQSSSSIGPWSARRGHEGFHRAAFSNSPAPSDPRDRRRHRFRPRPIPGPYTSDRRVIDVSGDGTNNSGRDVRSARDQAVSDEVTTINGLVIFSDAPIPYNPSIRTRPAGRQLLS